MSEWSKEHAWKVCKSKGFEGSNPSPSATNIEKAADFSGFFFLYVLPTHTLTHTWQLACLGSFKTSLDGLSPRAVALPATMPHLGSHFLIQA